MYVIWKLLFAVEQMESSYFFPLNVDSHIDCKGFWELYVLTMREVGITLQVLPTSLPKAAKWQEELIKAGK